MHNMPPERAFEMVGRAVPVTADGKPDKSKTNLRLGYSMQRLFQPVTDEQSDQLGHLLTLLDRCAAENWK
jgi:hypothetical protein